MSFFSDSASRNSSSLSSASTSTSASPAQLPEGWSFLPLSDPRLRLLREISDPPRGLFVRGDATVLALPVIAIVGARRASPYGLRAAMRFAHGLCELGIGVASGLARGIDSAAHRGSLAAKGKTIAVLGHGPQQIYPPENETLANAIVKHGGCLVTEYGPGVGPRKHHFPARNRILSGLSLGTLVVEAASKSGSLITARLALEQNREVFAVPGAFDSDNFVGCHSLIQQGAKLVSTPEEILAELPPQEVELPARATTCSATPSELETILSEEGVSLDSLYSRWSGDFASLIAALDEAKAVGRVEEWSPQFYVLCQGAVPGPRTLPNEKDLRTMKESRGPLNPISTP